MHMPEVLKVFNIFPLKNGVLLIAIFGISSGVFALNTAWSFDSFFTKGLITRYIMAYLPSLEEETKSSMITVAILISLFQIIANIVLLYGVAKSSEKAVMVADRVLLLMCLILIFIVVGMPASCYFQFSYCVIKAMHPFFLVIGVIFVTGFLITWLYFVVAVWNYEKTM